MKVTAGTMRGRKLTVPDIDGLRPSPSRAREALFNMLGNIQGSTGLDLFSGSGIIALEALSRGAASVTSIEAHQDACQAMLAVSSDWGVDGWMIQRGVLPQALPSQRHFNFIYADPPYGQGFAEHITTWLSEHHITFDTLVIEEASRNKIGWSADMQPNKTRKYGETTLYFFQPNIELVS